jgi:protein LTV1
VSGPRPDWDPDIVAALDDALDLEDPDNILDDDFMLKVVYTCKNTFKFFVC